MASHSYDERLEALTLELTVQRLITRSIILYLMLQDRQSLSRIVEQMRMAADRTTVDRLPLADVDPDLQAKASAIAQERGAELIYALGKVVSAEEGNRPTS